MADDPKHTNDAPPASVTGVALRKLFFTIAVLFAVWLIFGQLMPRYFMPKSPRQGFTASSTPTSVLSDPASDSEKDQRIVDLTGRIDTLEARLQALESVVTAVPPSPLDTPVPAADPATPPATAPEAVSTVPAFIQDARLAQLETKIKEQEESLQTMQEQIDETQTKSSTELATVTSLAQLKQTIERGENFAAPLARLRVLMPDNAAAQQALAELAPHAEKGVPTLAALKSGFEAAIPPALAPAQDNSLKANLYSLVRIRKVGEQQGSGSDAVIARAEARLREGDVEASLKELATLTPPAADAFIDWTQKAQAYQAVRSTVSALEAALVPAPDIPETAPESE